MSARVVEVDSLPFGQKAVWHEDLNIVCVLSGLSVVEREVELDQLYLEWRTRTLGSTRELTIVA